MSTILKHANKSRLGIANDVNSRIYKTLFRFGDKDDHAVLDGGRVIGRIFLSPQSPPDRNWMWTITAPDYPRSIHSRGY